MIAQKETSCRLISLLIVSVAFWASLFSLTARAERIIFPIVFSSPDTGFAGGAAVIWALPNPEAGENKNDTVRVFGFLTQKGQMMASVGASLYRDQGYMLLEPSVTFGKSAETSYGLGSVSSSDSEESYETEFVSLKFGAGWNLLRESYFGPTIKFQSREYTDVSEAVNLRRYLAANDEKLESTRIGLGVQLKRDTRNNNFYPEKGVYSVADFTVFDESWKSDYTFNLFTLEHRRFIPLDPRSVFAIQAKIKAASGHVPYDQLPSIGGSQSLRGVLQARFRDDLALSSQLEWRHILTQKIGVVAFTGFGDVFPSVDEVGVSDLKYAFGVGGRYALGQQQRINLSLDLGYSDALGDAEADGFNVYFQVGEAF